MRKAGIELQRGLLQYLRGHETRGADRHNLTVIAMHTSTLFKVFGEVLPASFGNRRPAG
jgi:hypothetical protein